MSFKSYLIKHKNLLIFWFLFHGFALFVNVFNIEYDLNSMNPPGVIEKKFVFTNSEYKSERKTFWPFVMYKPGPYYFTDEERNMLRDRPDFSQWRIDKFNGIFFQYDISEFIFYSILIFLILYLVWETKRKSNKQVSNENILNPEFPLKLIQALKEKGIIKNGLTVPYLLGAFKYPNVNYITKKDLKSLLDNLINSDTSQKPVFYYCGEDINEFVITLESNENCQNNYITDIVFYNTNGQKGFYILENAKKFGATKDELVDNLWNRYADVIKSHKFSWKSLSQSWEQFSEFEITNITEIQKS